MKDFRDSPNYDVEEQRIWLMMIDITIVNTMLAHSPQSLLLLNKKFQQRS